MNNNFLIKGLWAGIIISLTIGNIAIIPFGKINYIMMAVVSTATLILLIIALVLLVTQKKIKPSQIQKPFQKNKLYTNLNYPSIVSSQVYSRFNNPTSPTLNPQNETIEFKNTKIYQLSQDSVFTIPNHENGDDKKFFLQEHMSKNDQQFLNKLPN
jgi:hypothetical protein